MHPGTSDTSGPGGTSGLRIGGTSRRAHVANRSATSPTSHVVLALAAIACLALACGRGHETPAGDAANLFADGGFEQGGDAWAYVGSHKLELFQVTDSVAHGGAHSGHLFLDGRAGAASLATRVASAVQQPAPAVFPKRLAGWYLIGRWQPAADERSGLTLNVVVYVLGDPRTMEIVRPKNPNAVPPPTPFPGYGITYRLAGRPSQVEKLMETQSNDWGNLEHRTLGHVEPVLDQWVHFEIPLRDDFRGVWGVVPEHFEKLRVMLQLLSSNKPAGEKVLADVYFDDLELVPGN